MKDFLYQDISVGDYVALMRPNYREMTIGTVIALTQRKVRITYRPPYSQSVEFLTDPINTIRLNPDDATAKILRDNT